MVRPSLPEDEIRRPRVLPFLLTASLAGVFFALLHLWPSLSSSRGFSAILGAGVTYGVVLGAAVYVFRSLPHVAFCVAATLAGAAAGGAWWLIVRPTTSILLSASIAAGLSLVTAISETGRAR